MYSIQWKINRSCRFVTIYIRNEYEQSYESFSHFISYLYKHWYFDVNLYYSNYTVILYINTEIPFFRFFSLSSRNCSQLFHEIFHGYFSYWRHLSLQVYLYIMLNFVYNDIYTYIMLRDKLSYVAWVLNNGIMLDWKVKKLHTYTYEVGE